MGEQRAKRQSKEEALAEAEKQLKKFKEVDKKDSSDSKESKDSSEEKKKTKIKKTAKTKKTKKRSLKYLKAIKKFNKSKLYNLDDAIGLVKKISYAKFDGSVDLSIKLLKKKNYQPIRTIIDLPYGSGKKPKIVILDGAKIEEIRKTKKVNFDIALVSPSLMKDIARIAKILGPKGKMPNPKSGTITDNPERTKKEFETGKIEIKEDNQGIIHQVIGKVSWEKKKIIENVSAVIKNIPRNRLLSISLSATMSPGIKVEI